MTKRVRVACFLTVLAVVPLLAQADSDATVGAETRDYLQRLEKLGFAGAVLVARGGTPLLAEGYGWPIGSGRSPGRPGPGRGHG